MKPKHDTEGRGKADCSWQQKQAQMVVIVAAGYVVEHGHGQCTLIKQGKGQKMGHTASFTALQVEEAGADISVSVKEGRKS